MSLAVSLAGAAGAEPILWYHFSPDAPQAVNAVNPGTWDGTIRSYTYSSGKITYGDDSTKMPVFDGSFTNDFPRILDQTNDYGGAIVPTGGALNWAANNLTGGVIVNDADGTFRPQQQFTLEVFVKLPADAATRKDEMFPIAQLGEDMRKGWIFSIYRGRPFLRFSWKKSDGTIGYNDHGNFLLAEGAPTLYDGKWHHVAVTFSAGDDQCCARTFQDGTYIGAQRVTTKSHGWPSKDGLYYGTEGEALPFVIGGKPQTASRCYYGEIAEFRVSDKRLDDSGNRFMVPMVDGPVDADTAVMLQLGENVEKFGSLVQTNVTFTCDGATHYWCARNWNLLNAATNDVWQPRWFPNDGTAYQRQVNDDSAAGAVVRSDAVTPRSFADGKSMANETTSDKTDVFNIPKGWSLSGGDFTIEFFFKTTAPDSYTGTIFTSPYVSKWCVYQGGLLFRYTDQDGKTGDLKSLDAGVPKVNDGQWHHAAVTYRKAYGVIDHYLDYKLLQRRDGKFLKTATSGNTLVGGASRTSQPFRGNLDNIRITRRALRLGEFLVSREYVSDRMMDVAFEGDLTTGQDPTFAEAGTAVAFTNGTCALPTYVDRREGWVLDGENGPRLRAGGKALSLDGGYAIWRHAELLQRDDYTVEFFAKISSLPVSNDVSLIRLNQGQDQGYAPLWSVIHRNEKTKAGPERLVCVSDTTTNDFQYLTTQTKFKNGKVDDGKWHHWALTIDTADDLQSVTFTLYRDYEQYGSAVTVKGRLFWPNSGAGSCLLIGTDEGGSQAIYGHLKAQYDDLRVSPGVLPVSKFLRYEKEPSGMTLFVE